MKKILALSALLIVVSAPASFAVSGLNLRWSACPPSGTTDVPSLCSSPATLFGTFELDAPIATATALDYVIDFQSSDPTVPPNWQRGSGECNGAPPISLLTFYFPGTPGCTMPTDLAGPFGSQVSVSSASWFSGNAPGNPNPDNRGKLVGSVVRSFPGPLAAGPQFAAQWTIPSANTGTCAGCATPMALVWNSATIAFSATAGASPEAGEITIEGPGSHGNCATGAGGGGGSLCDATPTQNKTWGQIKNLYR